MAQHQLAQTQRPTVSTCSRPSHCQRAHQPPARSLTPDPHLEIFHNSSLARSLTFSFSPTCSPPGLRAADTWVACPLQRFSVFGLCLWFSGPGGCGDPPAWSGPERSPHCSRPGNNPRLTPRLDSNRWTSYCSADLT